MNDLPHARARVPMFLLLVAAAAVTGPPTATLATDTQATDTQAADTKLFEAKIQPVLAKNCYKCHSAAEGKSESGLTLDTRAGMRQGGDRGPAVVPGDARRSLILEALGYEQDDLQMPPDGRLPDSVIADFRKWIQAGAADPRERRR